MNISNTQEDTFFRYKMPIIEIKYEGKGNKSKTILLNLNDISQSLERKPEEILNFFKLKFNTSINEKIFSITGNFDIKLLNSCLMEYINFYVICKNCSNPETMYSIHKEYIKIKCKACGCTSKIENVNKFTNYIIKNK